MAVQKWSWQTANPAVNKPGSSSRYNATAAEVQKAYSALISKGPTRDFSHKVWNDLCAKILDINKEWQTGNYFTTSGQQVWVSTSGKLYAYAMNLAEQALIPLSDPPWKETLGRVDLQSGDIVKAAYFLWLVESVNHWCDLVPIWFSFTENDACTIVCPTKLAAAIHIQSLLLRMQMDSQSTVYPGVSLPFLLSVESALEAKGMSMLMLDSIPFSSLMNFSTLNMACTVWDKDILYVFPAAIDHTFQGKAKAAMSPALPFSYIHTFNSDAAVKPALGEVFPVTDIRFSGSQDARILPDLAGHIELGYRDSGVYAGTGRMRRARPLPMSILTPFQSNATVLVEFEGIIQMEVTDEGVRFCDAETLDSTVATAVDETGSIVFKEHAIQMKTLTTVDMNLDSGGIAVQSENLDLIPADVNDMDHKEPINICGDSTILRSPPNAEEHTGVFGSVGNGKIDTVPIDTLLHSGDFHSAGQFEMSFANEQSFEVVDGKIHVMEGSLELSFQDTQAVEHLGRLPFTADISLQDAPPLEIAAERSIFTESTGSLRRDKTLEQCAEALVKAVATGEISFGFNAQLLADMTAAQTASYAVLTIRQMAEIVCDAELTSKSASQLAAILRRLLEANQTMTTSAQGELMLRLLRYAESDQLVLPVTSEADILPRPAKIVGSGSSAIAAGYSAFLDASYIRGDGCVAEADTQVDAEVQVATAEVDHRMQAESFLQSMQESLLGKTPARGLDGLSIAQTDTEARMVMARSERILAVVYEDCLLSDLDNTAADELERHLIFE